MGLWVLTSDGATYPFSDIKSALRFLKTIDGGDMSYCPVCGSPVGLSGTCGSLSCGLTGGLNNLLARQAAEPKPPLQPYLERLKNRQSTIVAEIHLKERELATLTALIQFLTERPDVQDVAERVMEV